MNKSDLSLNLTIKPIKQTLKIEQIYIASQDKIPIFIKRKKPKYAVYNVHIHDFRLYPHVEKV